MGGGVFSLLEAQPLLSEGCTLSSKCRAGGPGEQQLLPSTLPWPGSKAESENPRANWGGFRRGLGEIVKGCGDLQPAPQRENGEERMPIF